MAIENKVLLVAGTPVTDTILNAEIYNQNINGYWFTDLKFLSDNQVAMLFAKTNVDIIGGVSQQKVNEVLAVQGNVDADAAAEAVSGYYPTGIFNSPAGTLFIAYTNLEDIAL